MNDLTYKVLLLNNISNKGLEQFNRARFKLSKDEAEPDIVLVRSASMHDFPINANLKAVARAGAGVNNIPLDRMTEWGIPVFNAPGANANAVKELVVAGMLLAARNIHHAIDYTNKLDLSGDALNKAVEAGKKQFSGYELSSRVLGVVGLGAVGVEVANVASSLGMHVIGFDPKVTIKNAWKLEADIERALNLDDLLRKADVVSMHVPLVPATEHMLNVNNLNSMRDNTVVLNFSRQGIVDDSAMLKGFANGKVATYITDFPNVDLLNHPKVISLPHLGASTTEAEENCAIMVVNQVNDFIRNGNIVNSVNYPETTMGESTGTRLSITNDNSTGMIEQISRVLAKNDLNIKDMLNKSRDDIAHTLIEVGGTVEEDIVVQLKQIEGIRSARICC